MKTKESNILSKTFTILYILFGIALFTDAIINICISPYAGLGMFVLIAFAVVEFVISGFIFGTYIRRLIKRDHSKPNENIHFNFRIVCSIIWVLIVSAIFLLSNWSYKLPLLLYDVIVIGLLVVAICGRATYNQKHKSILLLVSSILNIVNSVAFVAIANREIFGFYGTYYMVGLAVGLLIYTVIDVMLIALSIIQLIRLNKNDDKSLTIEMKEDIVNN